MADAPARLTVTSGFGQGGRFLQALLGLVALTGPVALAAAGIYAAVGNAEAARNSLEAVSVLRLWTLTLGPFALFRHRVVLDREAGQITHTWGFPGWSWGRRTYPLSAFRLDDSDAATYSRWVRMTDGKENVLLKSFPFAIQAWRLSGRVAEFLGQELRRPAQPPKIVSYLVTRFLAGLCGALGVIAGTGLLFGFLGWAGPWLPESAALRIATVVLVWTGSTLLCAAVLTSCVTFVPVGCPRCGGRARFVLSWWPYYTCRDCGSSWRPGKRPGFGGP